MPTKLSFPDRRILEDALCESPPFLTPRERQALIRNALGGHPESGRIDQALQYVDWSGGSRLVAGDLIRLLEGHEVAPGVPALAVIAEAIEPMAGAEHQGRVSDLRRRMGWTKQAAPAALPPDPAPSVASPFFISYASDDIAAARRLFDVLRAMGGADAVAWFDKSALRPGDDWHARILNAVRSCACFLPLISRQTESRTEGYFRLEWNEAAERCRRIQGRKFLFPIVIDPDYDGTMSRYALVPEEFKAAQYSHAPGGGLAEDLKAELAAQLRTS